MTGYPIPLATKFPEDPPRVERCTLRLQGIRRIVDRLTGRPQPATEAPAEAFLQFPDTELQRLVNTIRGADKQMTDIEYGLIIGCLLTRAPCKFLVFGQGRDSPLWAKLNSKGRTVFIEDNEAWFTEIADAESYLVTYPHLKLPAEVDSTHWDLVLVDAPRGHRPTDPGRGESVAAAASLLKPGGYAFVHDYDRTAEQEAVRKEFNTQPLVIDKLAVLQPGAAITPST